MTTDPYDDDDDSPTLQRPATAASTDTDLAPLDLLADAHTVDSLPPAEAVALMDDPDYADMETPKIPLDVAAVLLRASQDDDGSSGN